jgi:hypothetical protein
VDKESRTESLFEAIRQSTAAPVINPRAFPDAGPDEPRNIGRSLSSRSDILPSRKLGIAGGVGRLRGVRASGMSGVEVERVAAVIGPEAASQWTGGDRCTPAKLPYRGPTPAPPLRDAMGIMDGRRKNYSTISGPVAYRGRTIDG